MTPGPEPKSPNLLLLSVPAWLVHVALASGLAFRLTVTGPGYARTFADYNLLLPWLSQRVIDATGTLTFSPGLTGWLFAMLGALDLAVLLVLAQWERPLWKWWFWGVAVILILLLLLVEYAFFLPMWKLREALSR